MDGHKMMHSVECSHIIGNTYNNELVEVQKLNKINSKVSNFPVIRLSAHPLNKKTYSTKQYKEDSKKVVIFSLFVCLLIGLFSIDF